MQKGSSPLEHLKNKKVLLIALLDYCWVITIYVSIAFLYELIVELMCDQYVYSFYSLIVII